MSQQKNVETTAFMNGFTRDGKRESRVDITASVSAKTWLVACLTSGPSWHSRRYVVFACAQPADAVRQVASFFKESGKSLPNSWAVFAMDYEALDPLCTSDDHDVEDLFDKSHYIEIRI